MADVTAHRAHADPESHRVSRRRAAWATALDALHWAALGVLIIALLVGMLEAPLVPSWTPAAHRFEIVLFTPAQMVSACLRIALSSGLLVWVLPLWCRALRVPGWLGGHYPASLHRHDAGPLAGRPALRLALMVVATLGAALAALPLG